MGPFMELERSENFVRLFSELISDGIFPVILLYDKSRIVSLERLLICEGMVP
jgi:hypothetical protein